MALVGLLSDSHGRATTTARAAKLLRDRGAQVMIHLGDVCGEAVLEAMVEKLDAAGRAVPPIHVVFGNCDAPTPGLIRYARDLGIEIDHPSGRLDFDGKTLAYTHGHIESLMRAALDDGAAYLCHGHTHQIRDEYVGGTRVINPGALFRAARHTVALLDTKSDRLEIVQVPAD